MHVTFNTYMPSALLLLQSEAERRRQGEDVPLAGRRNGTNHTK